jgi:4,5-dihydroxyphthalate decarboxylase
MKRRDFLQCTATLAASLMAPASMAVSKTPLNLKAAGYRFPRTEALFTGEVAVEGAISSFQKSGIGDINIDIFAGPQTWDFCEIGLHPFMLAWANEGFRDYTLLPVFPLRLFRHKSIFIRTDRGIEEPEDLKGKRIATPGYSSTSLTWIRGLLQDEYGVTPQDVEWVLSRKDSSADVSGKVSAQENVIPDSISVQAGPEGMDESDLLANGEVDALFHAAVPRAFVQGHPKVGRLFADSRATEKAYFEKTGVFPIMHAVAVRKKLLEQHPAMAGAIFNAYSAAKSLAYRQMTGIGWGADMLPWYGQEMEATQALMGSNFYSYGLEGNRKSLETLFRYSHEQKLASRRLTVEELFYPGGMALKEGES